LTRNARSAITARLRGPAARSLARLASGPVAPLADTALLRIARSVDRTMVPLYCSYFEPRFSRARKTLTFPLRNGLRFTADLGDYPQKQILVAGIWEPTISSHVRSILRSGDVVVDVGANTGYYTLLAAPLVGSSGRVIAVEPNPSAFRLLEHNIRQNRLHGRVSAHCVAAAAEYGTLSLVVFEGRSGSATLAPVASGVESRTVRVCPLDDLVDPGLRGRIRLVKIDVEGAEVDVLRGATETLRSLPAGSQLIVEISFDADGRSEAVDVLRELGFRTFLLANAYWPLQAQMLPREASQPMRQDVFGTRTADVLFARSMLPVVPRTRS
jgi:FkbM family methyltransferase